MAAVMEAAATATVKRAAAATALAEKAVAERVAA